MAKNSYIGERALLFHEPRTATVKVISQDAELWAIEKATFEKIIAGNMQQQLMNRIRPATKKRIQEHSKAFETIRKQFLPCCNHVRRRS